jgi:choline dehydrogenase
MNEFDYIVVGAGAAGSLLAARLSDSGAKVCVLEAGPRDTNPFIHLPAGYVKVLFDPRVTWQLQSDPCEGTGGRALTIAQGRVLGGSSSMNGMIAVRGQRDDYDDWAALGNAGWSYAEVLPYFKRLERRIDGKGHAGDDFYRGRDGAFPVKVPDFPNALCDAFIASAAACGVPANPDYNGVRQEGAGRLQSNIHRGKRVSAARAFLHPAATRGNLDIRTQALASRVLFEGRRATGVEYIDGDGRTQTVKARQGVVLSAGSVHSPKLLQLSGVGPAALLKEHGLPVLHDLPGVGANLRDHYRQVFVLRAKGAESINDRVRVLGLGLEFLRWALGRPSALAIGAVLCHAYAKSDPSLTRTDIQMLFMPASFKAGFFGRLDDVPGMTCAVQQQRPESHGYVRIASSDVRVQARFNPNYLSDERDRRALLAVFRLGRRLFASEPMARHVDAELLPGPQVQTDDEFIAYSKQYAASSYHLIGSCRMGLAADPMAVVSPGLKVHGLEGLHVVDASVMPVMPSANTMVPTLMVAEKAADLILGKSALPAAVLPA